MRKFTCAPGRAAGLLLIQPRKSASPEEPSIRGKARGPITSPDTGNAGAERLGGELVASIDAGSREKGMDEGSGEALGRQAYAITATQRIGADSLRRTTWDFLGQIFNRGSGLVVDLKRATRSTIGIDMAMQPKPTRAGCPRLLLLLFCHNRHERHR